MRLLNTGLAVAALALSAFGLSADAAVRFNFIPLPGTSQQAIDAFNTAGQRWSSSLTNDVTINLQIGFTSLGADVLSHTDSTWTMHNYAKVRGHLLAGGTSKDDRRSAAALPKGSVRMLVNHTLNHPNSSNRAIPYLDNDRDANNTRIRMHSANAKALGLMKPNARSLDGSIIFGSDYLWDFNVGDGITSDAFDFVGLAVHEIGHAMGFVSGVDTLEATVNAPMLDHHLTAVTPLDLFRYSSDSAQQTMEGKKRKSQPAIDFTADARDKFFSINGGKSALAEFAAGVISDGNQASHWKDGSGTGLFDPVFRPGQSFAYSRMDLRALDVIGWDLTGKRQLAGLIDPIAAPGEPTLPVVSLNALRFPEPGMMTFAVVGMIALARRRSRLAV